ncbi:class I SAM-dependent methyltransferase [Candidatus Parcubacteria bacterium]|nr:class I SAM-dependent methyltransferase [Candidatus Parcubacteria bacterium]
MSNYSSSEFNLKDTNNSWTKTFDMIPPGSSVMDIGCSSGVFGEALIKQKKCTVDGIEIDDDDIKEARKKLRKVYKINVETDSLDVDDKYDVVFMGDVIEHLARPIEALKKIRSLLKPDGVLIFSMPNITHMSVRLMILKGNIEYGRTGLLDETHLHFYNKEEVYRVLNAAGYKITKFDYVVRDVPLDVAAEELSEVGLKPTKEFRKLLQSLNAAAYQFIGSAKPGPHVNQALPIKSPLDITDKHISNWRKQNKNEYKKLEKKHTELKNVYSKVKQEHKEAQSEVIRLKKSRVVRLYLKGSKLTKRNEKGKKSD